MLDSRLSPTCLPVFRVRISTLRLEVTQLSFPCNVVHQNESVDCDRKPCLVRWISKLWSDFQALNAGLASESFRVERSDKIIRIDYNP